MPRGKWKFFYQQRKTEAAKQMFIDLSGPGKVATRANACPLQAQPSGDGADVWVPDCIVMPFVPNRRCARGWGHGHGRTKRIGWGSREAEGKTSEQRQCLSWVLKDE